MKWWKMWWQSPGDPPRLEIPFFRVGDEDAAHDLIFAPRSAPVFRLADMTTRPGFLIFLDRREVPVFGLDHMPIPDGFRRAGPLKN